MNNLPWLAGKSLLKRRLLWSPKIGCFFYKQVAPPEPLKAASRLHRSRLFID
jgi:hypothetical protein